MENRFLGLIEKSVKVHWDLPAFTDMEGSTLLYKDVARRMEELHILFRCAEIQPGEDLLGCRIVCCGEYRSAAVVPPCPARRGEMAADLLLYTDWGL